MVGLVLAVLSVGVGMWALMGGGMMGGGMMGGSATGFGAVGAAVAVAFLVAAVLMVGRAMGSRPQGSASVPPPVVASPPAAAAPAKTPEAFDPASLNEVDALTLPLLDRDERLLYLEIKESGRSALQKDIGHRDGFSRSKVTRTLDRLEAKGLIARERDGMTNRVRLNPRRGTGGS